MTRIKFRMINPRPRRHNLHIPRINNAIRPHRILMRNRTLHRNSHDLHIIMWMFAKTHSSRNAVIIQHAQRTKMYSRRIMIASKTKTKSGL